MGLDELPEEARLTDTRLTHHGHDLAMASLREPERLAKLGELVAPGHERRESCAQPQPGSLKANEPVHRFPRRSLDNRARGENETALEERTRRFADEHG